MYNYITCKFSYLERWRDWPCEALATTFIKKKCANSRSIMLEDKKSYLTEIHFYKNHSIKLVIMSSNLFLLTEEVFLLIKKLLSYPPSPYLGKFCKIL